ncbi:MAG: hypothetical protein KatS3mg001_597 [Candidatus Pacearchaeota archaeon]|nr:MAG: hypothetical protein KatS3mg001_597 [Candidatus Pacearchaeota archaeon]
MIKIQKIQDPNKGQHFLVSKEIIKKEIKEANISKKDLVIEIGAGTGNLTEELSKYAGKVIAYEIDKSFENDLMSLQKNYENLIVIFDDAFNHSWKNCTKIVSNIPFYVSDKIIFKAIQEDIKEIILLVGEKFKKKLSNRKTKIGFIANLFYEIEFLMKVKKENFYPRPRVDSWLIRLKIKKPNSKFESILRSFILKKGKIKNAIIYSFVENKKTKREARYFIKKAGFFTSVLEKPVSRVTGNFLVRLENSLKSFL